VDFVDGCHITNEAINWNFFDQFQCPKEGEEGGEIISCPRWVHLKCWNISLSALRLIKKHQ
jgi:hypothetical protein